MPAYPSPTRATPALIPAFDNELITSSPAELRSLAYIIRTRSSTASLEPAQLRMIYRFATAMAMNAALDAIESEPSE